jgi:hypothetical protein
MDEPTRRVGEKLEPGEKVDRTSMDEILAQID